MSWIRTTRALLAGGIVGPVVFVAVFSILGAARPGYDPMRMFVSLLSLSDGGSAQVASFLACGLLIIAAALGVRRVVPSGIGSRWAVLAVGLAGLGFVLAGIFPTDPVQGYPPGTPLEMPSTASWHAVGHLGGALLFFTGLPIAAIILARRFAAAGDIGWAAYSLASGVGVVLFNAITTASPGSVGMVPDVAGLLQRISIILGLGWLAILSARLIRQVPHASEAGGPGTA